MSKITTEHLARSAYVYIRQSTADQLTHNHESRRRQYGLANRARQLGWASVEVIDDDLGRSGGGVARPGFERLLAAICEARVGGVLAIEASRLARNGRDWHTLIEFCGLVGTVIVDEDGIYDPRHPNDRLLLGMKGTMSELELSLFRQRSQQALKQKASRGALILGVAAGYVRVGRDRIEKNPDQRVREALQLVFSKFAEFKSVRQVHLWLRDERVELPVKSRAGETRGVVWRLPAYNVVHNILTNPIYAGAYAFGRTTSKVSVEQGRKRVRRGVHRPMAQWDVLIKDHHEAYITWDQFQQNQRVIAENATGKGSAAVKGAVRRGELLLPGLLRCGHCGRKLHVSYSGKLGRYSCYGARMNHGTARCISIETIAKALTGSYRAEHLFALEQALALYDAYQDKASACDARIEAVLKDLSIDRGRGHGSAPRVPRRRNRTDQANALTFDVREALFALLGKDVTTIEGLGPYVSLKLIAECGDDLSPWPGAKHFTSWLGLAPSNKISGGKMLSSRTRRSGGRAAALLRLAAVTVGRTDTALGAFYRRLASRIGKAKAVTATARKIAVLFYNAVRYGMDYVDPGASSYETRYRARVVSNLQRRAKVFGFVLQPLEPKAGAAVS